MTWIEVSRGALQANLRQFRQLLPSEVAIMAVVKSNAYGHGLSESAKSFVAAGANWLGVANDEEAMRLTPLSEKIPTLILSYFSRSVPSTRYLVTKNVRFPVYLLEQARHLSRIGQSMKKNVLVHIKIDTGLSRLGFQTTDAVRQIKRILRLPHLSVEGIFSHFAESENPRSSFTNKQLDRFESSLTSLEASGISPAYRHIACSASTLLKPRSRLNLVRIGIGLYGLSSIEGKSGLLASRPRLHPALSWFTRVIQVKSFRRGDTIGYGRTFRVAKPTRVAILATGYSDGYDRGLSNVGHVVVRGRLAKVVGRVSMNLTTVDVTHIPNVKVGDAVALIGRQGKAEVTADDLAKNLGTINYEVVSRINPDLPRVYV